MTIIPVLKGYKDKWGKHLIQIKVADGTKRKFYSTKIKIAKTDWDDKTLQVKPEHPNAKQYNTIIRKKVVELESEQFNDEGIKEIDLFKYLVECIGQWERVKASETIRQYWSEVNKLKRFPAKKISDINLSWLNKYVQHLYQIGNTTNTVWKSLKFVRLIIRKAYRERISAYIPQGIRLVQWLQNLE